MGNVRRLVTVVVFVSMLLFTAGTAQAAPFTFFSSFDSLPAGTSLFGEATLDSGILKLIDAGTFSAFGAYAIDLGASDTFESFNATWKSLLGGGVVLGADGYSFNVAADLPTTPTYGDPGEEGSGTGLSVTVDTWDNGSGDLAPGIGIMWNGSVVASMLLPKDDDGSGNYLRKNSFVDAGVSVTPAGLVTFLYDGNILSTVLLGYSGLLADQIMFGARTGGADDNHWIDDLSIVANRDEVVVPEPGTFALVGLGLAGLVARRRRLVTKA